MKAENAQKAGASAVVLFNEGTIGDPERQGLIGGTLGAYVVTIPVLGATYATGKYLVDHPAATVSLSSTTKVERLPTQNLIAETKTGRADRTVISGSHHDSVAEGPGINDDGSGAATQLELAEQIAKAGTPPRNKIRFMWFGGEEEGLVGSQYYAAQLSQAAANRVMVMIDTDMIASSNYVRFVYDGDGSQLGPAGPPGSGTVEQVFKRYFAQQGMATLPQAFDGRSDYVGFINRGIPAGGIFAGAEVPKTPEQAAVFGGVAGEQYDPCYHEPCDNVATLTGQPPADTMNVYEQNPTPANLAIAQQQANSLNGNALRSLREMSGAVTHAVWYFARVKNTLPPRTAAARKAVRKRTAAFKFQGHLRARTR